MYLTDLIVTQSSLRDYDQIPQMASIVRNGGYWTLDVLEKYNPKSTALIQISRFEDGLMYIHDGHHRAVATWLGGRVTLREDEYQVREYTYERYMTTKLKLGYFTPFDPRTHVRKPEFFKFKMEAQVIYDNHPEQLEDWIKSHENEYKEVRDVYNVYGLVTKLVNLKLVTL